MKDLAHHQTPHHELRALGDTDKNRTPFDPLLPSIKAALGRLLSMSDEGGEQINSNRDYESSEEIYPPPLVLGANAALNCDYWCADYRQRLEDSGDIELAHHTDESAIEEFDLMLETSGIVLEQRIKSGTRST
jgi:hypothetical protein